MKKNETENVDLTNFPNRPKKVPQSARVSVCVGGRDPITNLGKIQIKWEKKIIGLS